ncbi:SusC/RagA family TonB-linked outer membrane protein [Spirosoma utsteinense]|uniref:TonB-linked SusC/RagA family outer membrane protein n=1 Tax=Spirosoma utsteinense TaxID=2585773 RepID=A0ABR6W0B6_9BACT|nr:TonB-dependent receptor [Spirosoma utsteinense]MBC3786570.1 TonB-linked SusC/RagA family outer membrane protein [Spirosoma utsteinense]MBC3789948.1 TonB-linked SusC/RagA family outer membrane protein [Spirosoma utsteinense]
MKAILYRFLQTVFVAAFMLLFNLNASAQDRRVTGKISSADGPIPGANVVLKGTSTGTSTDANGEFTLSVRGANPVLVVSAIGSKTQEVTVGNRTTVDLTLADDATALDEVVVTGYTTDTKRETTGAVSTVKAKALTAVPSGNVEQQLQGRVSGLTVITNGQPGTASQVRVRGFGAFGGNEPLYVVDGVPVGNTEFLAPDDIESTTVLKDAASASIYGARAANGVIVYTTKKGARKSRKLSISYDGQLGATDPGTGLEMLNPTEYAQWTWNQFRNTAAQNGEAPAFSHPQFGTGASPVIPDFINVGGAAGVVGSVDLAAERLKYNTDPKAGSIYQVVRANKQGTDWYDAITRVAPLQRHTLGFSGGGENNRFYISFSAQDQKGILLSNSFKRYTFRANSEYDLSKRVRLGENVQFTYRSVLGQNGDNNGSGVASQENDILQAFRMPSIIPVYDEFGGYAGTAAKGFNNPRNPRANQDGLLNNRGFGINGTGNVYLEIDPIEHLTLRSSVGGGIGSNYFWGYSRLQYENSENNSAFGYNEGSGYGMNWVITNTASYKRQIGIHKFDVLAGQEALNTGVGRNMQGNGQNPFSTDTDYINLNTVSATGRTVGSGYGKGVNFFSVFGRVNYSFNDKYIVTGLIRRDGSSRFGSNNRYGVFPAASAAWRISSENFMKNLPWVTDLKIRGGYGIMGNSNNVNPNNQYSLYAANLGNSAYDINGSNSSTAEGYYRSRIGNPNAKWETSVTTNFGLDGSFFGNRLEVVLDIWRKDTKDLLFQVPVPDVIGTYADAPSVNIGQMRNEGIDLQVITRGKIGSEVGFEANITGSLLSNKIVALAPGLTYLTSVNPGFRGINPIRNQLNYSISSFYGYKTLGLFQTKEEVAAAPKQDGAAPGRFRFADIDGNGKIDADDRTYLGSPVPKFTGGLNLKFTYKGFDIETYAYASVGNKIFNVSKWFTDFYPSFAGAAISARVKDSWTPTNTGATVPIYEAASNFSTNSQSNSYYVEDGSYFRLQNLSIGYNIPASFLSRIGLQRARVFASTNNLLTITKYQGLDPSVGGAADTNFGIDVGNYPITRSFTGGLSFGF